MTIFFTSDSLTFYSRRNLLCGFVCIFFGHPISIMEYLVSIPIEKVALQVGKAGLPPEDLHGLFLLLSFSLLGLPE